jgi:hypothetical protein
MILDLSYPMQKYLWHSSPMLGWMALWSASRHLRLLKMDLDSVYRQKPVHPGDHHCIEGENLCGQGTTINLCLCSAPNIFSAVVDLIAWALHVAGIDHLIHSLGDFLFLVAPNSEEGAQILSLVLEVFAFLVVPVAMHPCLCCCLPGNPNRHNGRGVALTSREAAVPSDE